MKRWLISILGCMLFCSLVIAQSENWQDDAEYAYLMGNYQQAIDLYSTAIEQGFISSDVYFNLGNAYYESGNLGLALLNYLRAQQIAPRDLSIDETIMRVRAIRADYQGDSHHWMDRLAESTYTLFRTQELTTVTLILWVIWFSLLTVYFLRRRWWLGLSSVIVWGCVLMLFCRVYADTQRPKAIITNLIADVRSGPSNDYLMLYELYNGAELRITEQQGGWARFILPDGRKGWINRFTFEYVNQ
jgi:tetratricopeptide (TPR) repeat protein